MDEFTRLVQSLLLDEFKDFDKRIEKLQALGHQEGCGEFLGACFILAARRRFTPESPVVDIIRFVANTRVVYDLTGNDIDPRIAERLLRAASGEPDSLTDLDPAVVRKIQIVLVHKLIEDEALYDDEIEDFIAQANSLAIRWRTQAAIEALERLGYSVKMPAPRLASPEERIEPATNQIPLAS